MFITLLVGFVCTEEQGKASADAEDVLAWIYGLRIARRGWTQFIHTCLRLHLLLALLTRVCTA